MKLKSIALAGLLLTTGLAFATTPQSVTVIKFGDANTLFVGDSKSATLYAYTVAVSTNPEAQKAYNIHNLSSKLPLFQKQELWTLSFVIWL